MLLNLNPAQREAVRYLDGPLLVLAGAGSGKTRVITEKLAYLVGECALDPASVVAITFTNKAAREMRERAAKRLGEAASAMFIGTFHAFGVSFLRQEGRHAGLKSGFSIFDAHDAASLVAELARPLDKAQAKRLLSRISLWKNALLEPEAIAPTNDEEEQAARLYTRYERALRAYQAVDFDDLIRLPAMLLMRDEMLAARWQSRIGHLLIDEYQDTNRSQNFLLRLLAGRRAAFTAVGDDDQAIYAWRGAEVENLDQLARDFPTLKVIKLEQNYRSTGAILTAANALIAHNPKLHEKRLWSEKGSGAPIRVKACQDETQEASWVAMKLLADKLERRARFSDYAILYRGNHQARAFEQALRTHRIPYKLSGGPSFFEKSEIKDLIAYLRLLTNENDDPAFIRAATTPRRGIGAGTLEALGHAATRRGLSLLPAIFAPGIELELKAAGHAALVEFGTFIRRFARDAPTMPARAALERLLAAIGYRSWLQESCERREAEAREANLREFLAWLAEKGEEEGKSLLELAQGVALAGQPERRDDDADGVQLATLHAAKGLEFPHVFLVGVEEGILPHRESLAGNKIEEERRLMYVGITRARETLTITWRRTRRQGQESVPCEPSRFIVEMGVAAAAAIEGDGCDKAQGLARLSAFKALLARSP